MPRLQADWKSYLGLDLLFSAASVILTMHMHGNYPKDQSL